MLRAHGRRSCARRRRCVARPRRCRPTERALAKAPATLRHDDREILLLHAWAGLAGSEIAEALSLPAGTVKSRLHRTREHLRNELAPSGQERDRPTALTDGETTP